MNRDEIIVPELRVPFASRISPFVEDVAEHTIRWAGRYGLIKSGERATRFQGESFGRLVAHLYPEAAVADLAVAADLNSWFHVFDDMFELTSVGREPAMARRMMADAEAVLNDQPVAGPVGPMLLGLADLRDRLRLRGGAVWWKRFVAHMSQCFTAGLWEVDNQARSRIPDPKSYVDMKLSIAYVPPSFDLIELVEHFEVPAAVRAAPEYQTLLHEAGHVVVCSNDIISLKRELQQGTFHNLVIVLHNAHGGTLQEAVDQVCQIISCRVASFLGAKAALPALFERLHLPEFIGDATLRCVTGLEHWMRGYLDWALATRRFSGAPLLASQAASFSHELYELPPERIAS